MMTAIQRPSRRRALGLIGAALVLPRVAWASGIESVAGTAFGTSWRIAAPEGSGVAQLASEVEGIFARIDRLFSPWRPDSTLSRFNAGPAGAHSVAPELAGVTVSALQIARRSEGAFDPTIGPVVARRGFGPIRAGGAPDWRGLSAGQGALAKARDDLTLDLCGIAKGHALDEAARLLSDAGQSDLLFELGGEFIALGQHPGGRDWRIAVEAPMPSGPAQAALRLPAGGAVATSGTGVQSYVVNGRLYSHIVTPSGGAAPPGSFHSVTVIAEDAMSADGWATALCAAGPEAGPDLAATEGIAALFLTEAGGLVRQVRTGAIAEFVL